MLEVLLHLHISHDIQAYLIFDIEYLIYEKFYLYSSEGECADTTIK